MGRVIVPLELMGARIESHDSKPPLTIHGAALKGIRIDRGPERPDKSAVLLAVCKPPARPLSRSRPPPAITPSWRCELSATVHTFATRLSLREARLARRRVRRAGDISSAASGWLRPLRFQLRRRIHNVG